MGQEQGIVGKLVGKMIRNTVRARFHTVYWNEPAMPPGPVIFICTHHGWHDGYLMFHAITKLKKVSVDWIQEFDSFPQFAKIGGMPFPLDRPEVRFKTIRETIRLMKSGTSLVLFAEQQLHRPPEILPLGGAIELIQKAVPDLTLIPVGIYYELSMHERPEAILHFGEAIKQDQDPRDGLVAALEIARSRANMIPELPVLVHGTKDVNERWDMRSKFGKK